MSAASRLLGYVNGRVRFRWKDYRANNNSKVMTLDADEFIRRFLLHTLPKGFAAARRAKRRQSRGDQRECGPVIAVAGEWPDAGGVSDGTSVGRSPHSGTAAT
jgi:hypothetical protein